MDLNYLGYILYMENKEKEKEKENNLINYKEVNPKFSHNAESQTPTTGLLFQDNRGKSQNITPTTYPKTYKNN